MANDQPWDIDNTLRMSLAFWRSGRSRATGMQRVVFWIVYAVSCVSILSVVGGLFYIVLT